MNIRFVIAAGILLALPVAAYAQPVAGPYVSLGGGVNVLSPVHYHFYTQDTSGRFLFRPDYTVIGGVGYGFGNGVRVEVGGDFLRDTAHKEDDSAAGQSRVFGTENKWGGMANLIYDLPVGVPVFPYLGAGAGYQFVGYDRQLRDPVFRAYHTEGSFAYDLLAGLSYPVALVPDLSVDVEYRFMQMTESRKYRVVLPKGQRGDLKLGQESTSSLLFGLRYQLFNPPPPSPALVPVAAPVAAPAPAPAKTYLVFFDWDKSNLTPRALDIIAQAAADSKTIQTTTIDISGYTDTSGTAVYNQGLSERRAKAVAAQLVADGVQAGEIETHAFGETHLLVPTGPGVREPQNRRVEIVL